MSGGTAQRARVMAAADAAIVIFPRSKDGEKGILCARLDRAARLYDARADASAHSHVQTVCREWADDCRHYKAEIESGDPLAWNLLRHFAAGLCEYIEARQ